VADARRAGSWGRPVIVLAIAAGALAAPIPPSLVDRFYAPPYAVWQRVVTPAFDWLPFAPFDLWLAVTCVVLVVAVRRAVRRARPGLVRALAGAILSVFVVASVAYLWFLASWGLNYRRAPLTARLDISRERVTASAVRALATRTVTELNRLHAPAWASGWPEWRDVPALLMPTVPPAAAALGLAPPRPGAPRVSLLQPYFRWASIEGMTDPFLLDVIVNGDLLPVERPAMVAHEWGHLAGLAREAEASYFGWRVCQAGDARTQYSAWLFLYGYVMNSIDAEARRPLMASLADGPRRDLRAMAERSARAVPAVRDAAWQAYDRYLKSNRVPEGVRSYDDVLVLILGGRDPRGQ
jgi:Protein of unknown function (DUF3810)